MKEDELEAMRAHALTGIINEWAEFGMLCPNGMPTWLAKDHIEELGDLLFYYTAFFDIISTEGGLPEVKKYKDYGPIALTIIDDISNVMKKHFFYRTVGLDEVYTTVLASYKFLIDQYTTEKWEHIAQVNIEKLSKRYEKSFTPEEAVARKDKECQEDSDLSFTDPLESEKPLSESNSQNQ
jgi:hypothetical protein